MWVQSLYHLGAIFKKQDRGVDRVVRPVVPEDLEGGAPAAPSRLRVALWSCRYNSRTRHLLSFYSHESVLGPSVSCSCDFTAAQTQGKVGDSLQSRQPEGPRAPGEFRGHAPHQPRSPLTQVLAEPSKATDAAACPAGCFLAVSCLAPRALGTGRRAEAAGGGQWRGLQCARWELLEDGGGAPACIERRLRGSAGRKNGELLRCRGTHGGGERGRCGIVSTARRQAGVKRSHPHGSGAEPW